MGKNNRIYKYLICQLYYRILKAGGLVSVTCHIKDLPQSNSCGSGVGVEHEVQEELGGDLVNCLNTKVHSD